MNVQKFKNTLSLAELNGTEKNQKITELLKDLQIASKNAVDVTKEVATIKEDIKRREAINELIKEVSMIERDGETFVDLYGKEEWAEVSNFGRIRFKKDYQDYKAGDILKPCLNNDFYLNFVIDGRHYFNHEAVLLSFIGEKPANHQADHINRCTLDNSVSNLHYVSKPENMKNREYTPRANNKGKVLVEYNIDFQPKAVYRSVKDAIFVNGWGDVSTGIYRAVKRGTTAKGSYWRWKSMKVY